MQYKVLIANSAGHTVVNTDITTDGPIDLVPTSLLQDALEEFFTAWREDTPDATQQTVIHFTPSMVTEFEVKAKQKRAA